MMFSVLRPHQWIKNILVALPAFAAHQFDQPNLIIAFISLCALSSVIYILNDIIDIEADRAHPTKRYRAIASGKISQRFALVLAIGCGFVSAGTSALLSDTFRVALILYITLAMGYLLYFKRQLMLDVVVLALLYGVRVLAGAEATSTHISDWLVGFCLFLFLSLALLKRVVNFGEAGRPYIHPDHIGLNCMGIASSIAAIVMLSLYIKSYDVMAFYLQPELLWGIVIVMAWWLGRVWILAGRGKVDGDPVWFAITDPASWVAAVFVIGIFVCSSW